MDYRIEKDTLGDVKVPKDSLWGAQTERSKKNFKIGNPSSMPIEIIHAYAILKKSAAATNEELGVLSKEKSLLIQAVCDEIISNKHNDHFPLVVWQTGSGTQTNMNVNEVISNRAHIIEGKKLGESEKTLSPNDDVNLSQSSNDTFPTAINIAAMKIITDNTLVNLKKLRDSLNKKAKEFNKIVKIGRTHLMDATPITLGQEFSGYVAQIDNGIKSINNAIDHLSELPIGGTAVGTELNTPKGYSKKVVEYISTNSGLKFKESPNKFEGIASHDCIVEMHGALKTVATSIYKISNDIRLMGSGPRSGLGELILPANEPGSSIMPGKINPTQCEAISMVCAQIIGNDMAVSFAGANGHFELNVFKPLFAYNIIESSKILGDACLSFSKNCIEGLKPNKKKIEKFLNDSLMLVTALNSRIGYYKAAEIANKAYKEDITLKEACINLNYLSDKEFDKYVNPERMTNNEG
ncbi:MAG: class II fumarate hydratase [Bacteroidetes bacterium]|nr:class II fumarate hydratase [Bacteroidota bacterium]MDA0884951.1 class II fumarate hydratase [Bacteroidota bacterium]MDA1225669.1 class II fumarate hydratase [Bacteroidota bacterium]